VNPKKKRMNNELIFYLTIWVFSIALRLMIEKDQFKWGKVTIIMTIICFVLFAILHFGKIMIF